MMRARLHLVPTLTPLAPLRLTQETCMSQDVHRGGALRAGSA